MKNFQYILTHSSGNLTLEHNPVNWDEFNVMFARSEDYHSVLRSQILEVELPFDGKAYVDDIYDTYGIDAEIGCEIKYLDKATFTYTTLYTGIIDLTEWTSRRNTTSVKVIDSSVLAKFQARHETEVPLNRTEDLDDNTISVYDYLADMVVTPVDIWEQIYMSLESLTVYADGSETPLSLSEDTIETVTIAEIEWDDADRDYENGSGGDESLIYSAGAEVTYDFTMPAIVGVYVLTAKVVIYEGSTPITIAEETIEGAASTVHTGSFTDTINNIEYTIPDGNYLGNMELIISGSTGIIGNWKVTDGFVQIFKITTGVMQNTTNMPLLHEAGARLLEIITGVSDPLNCSLIGRTDSEPRTYDSDGDYATLGIATGNMLRGYTFGHKPLITSFADYFKSIDALMNLGCWYNGSEFIIDSKDTFYRDEEIIDLGDVQDLEISVATEKYFNTINCGYRDELSYNEVSGNQNFNVPMSFGNPSKVDNDLDISSPYHGDDYGIELSRKTNYKDDFSVDTDYDDQIFFVWGERDGAFYTTVQGDDLNEVEGVYSPETRLNLYITPKRNLRNHRNQLSIPLWKSEAKTFYLEKQFELDLLTKIGTEDIIEEKEDFTYSGLQEPLYYPELYNFTSKLTFAHILQLQSDPHGYVTFTYDGETYTGFILEVSSEPFNRKGNWTLIRRNPNR